MKKKRLLAATAVGFGVWLVLLIALIIAEHGQEGTGIHTVWDAA